MEVQPKRPSVKGSPDRFVGDSWFDAIVSDHGTSRLRGGVVHFAPGARTAWHAHALGQTLRVLEGIGRTQARGGDMIEIRRNTPFVAGLPVEGGDVGGDPGPHTSLGVFLGIKAAVRRALGKDSVNGLHIALQGAGSVASGVALHAAQEGARISIADVDQAKARKLAEICRLPKQRRRFQVV